MLFSIFALLQTLVSLTHVVGFLGSVLHVRKPFCLYDFIELSSCLLAHSRSPGP